MFAVLEIEEYQKGLIKRLQRFFESDEPVMSYCTVKGAVPFITIRMKAKRSGINWREVRNVAGVCSQRLLLSGDIEIREGHGVVRFKPTVYRAIPLFNSMVNVMSDLDRIGDLNVTVLDRAGALCDRIDSLLDCARNVTVLTDNIAAYQTASKRVMDNLGAALVIYDYDRPEIADNVVFADKYDDRLEKCKVVFCPEGAECARNVIGAEEIEADEYVCQQKPDFVELFDFVAALYEYNGFKRAAEYGFGRLIFNGYEIKPEEVGEMIRQAK